MRQKKSGDLAIPKILWQTKAYDYEEFSALLSAMAREAKEGLDRVVGMDKTPAAVALVETLADVVAVLEFQVSNYIKKSDAAKALGQETRAGRPRAMKSSSTSNRLIELLSRRFVVANRKRGRPPGSHLGPDPKEVFRAVEAVRLEHGVTIAEAIRLSWPSFARSLGHKSVNSESVEGKKRLSNLYYAGKRGTRSAAS